MNAISDPSTATARRAWMAVFARTPCAELEAAFDAALEGAAPPAFDWLRAPQIGLAMVRGRIGGTGDAFNVGEATVTRATLRLCGDGEKGTIGVAYHLGRDKRRAEVAALADALAFFECEAEAVYQAGDHAILVGRVLRFAKREAGEPLVFFQGRYGALAAG